MVDFLASSIYEAVILLILVSKCEFYISGLSFGVKKVLMHFICMNVCMLECELYLFLSLNQGAF